MSWEVGDDDWLASPVAVPGSGPVDPLDQRVIQAMSTAGLQAGGVVNGYVPGDSVASSEPSAVPDAFELPTEGLPPPPYSAAFDQDADAPSYESGSFVAEPEPAAEPELDFHIPVLALGVVADPPQEPAASPAAAPPLQQPEIEAPAEPAAFVIPTLSAASAGTAAAVEEGFEEVEAEELEEVAEPEQPIRTGDTVIARAPEPAPTTDDDAGAMVIPELIDRIDSGELEILQDPADDAIEENVVSFVEPGPADAGEEAGFVIPALARPEQEAAPVEAAPEIVIPTMVAVAEPAPAVEPEPAVEPQPAVADHERVEEDAEEVDAEAIESLDSADLEELEQLVAVAVAVESPEAKPPAPPEAKPQAKRRKGWYDDVFAEHFLFLYPLTWEQTCQRDAQFIFSQLFSQLGGREGLSLLDVGCGDGSHAVELAKLGVRVTGLDNSLALLLAAAQNKDAAGFEDGRVEFIHGDMRRLPRDREFDAVICVGTTLGYFEEEQNWSCLQEMHDRLRPGGRLLIHVFNRDFVAPHLPSRSWWQGKRCMVIDEAEMNFFANRLRVHRTIIFDDGRQYEHYMFMRAYTVQDLGKAISQLGMRVIQVSGSRDTVGRFYGSASPDIWIVAEKK